MTNGVWFALCECQRAISISELKSRLSRLRNLQIHERGDELELEVRDRRSGELSAISIGFSSDPHVTIEAAEIADRHGRPELRALDGRYELIFDLQRADEVYNTLAHVAGELEEATGAVIYNANEGQFL
jgi:hypothetical protein